MNYLYDVWDDFISLLFPRLCYGCGNHLIRNENVICTECYVLIPRTNYHIQRANPVEQLFWGRCLIQKAAAFSYFNRGSRIRNLIHGLKYKGIREIGTELGKIYGRSLKEAGFMNDIDIIIPVPLHFSKMKSRGFNQSELICSGLSEATGILTDNQVVTRIKGTSTQTRRSRYERWTNVEGIFNISDKEKLKGKHILLVDDVITTGSTIESCVNELLKIDDVRVSVIALAFAVM